MKEFTFLNYVTLIVTCLVALVAGLYLLGNFNRIFTRWIRNEWARQNLVAWLAIFCFLVATLPLNAHMFYALRNHGAWHATLAAILMATINTIFVFNIVKLVANSRVLLRMSFIRQKALVLLVLVVTTVLFNLPISYLGDNNTNNLKYSAIISVYMATITGLVYILASYLDLERNRRLREKELELSQLNELKTKAELDALHSKVNPHFLYNALNSIADLAITDGKKARKMTIALADLFRYSINYSRNNFTTVKEELAMTEVYLQIEKIRFEDQLSYLLKVQEGVGYYLIPRFLLQPLVENAVKHGLKATGKMTEIELEIAVEEGQLVMRVADSGPPFPVELNPGYGVKSVYDKLDLLFPQQYEIHFSNQPRKHVAVFIKKLLKNEQTV